MLLFFDDRTLDSATLRNPVSETPSEDEKLAHRIITPPSQSMFLMADLRKLDGYVGINPSHYIVDDFVCAQARYFRGTCAVSYHRKRCNTMCQFHYPLEYVVCYRCM